MCVCLIVRVCVSVCVFEVDCVCEFVRILCVVSNWRICNAYTGGEIGDVKC